MTIVGDDFNRSVPSGWGQTPSGLTWVIAGGQTADRQVAPGAGRVTLHTEPGTVRIQHINRSWADGETLLHLRVGQVSQDQAVLTGAVLRHTGGGTFYRARLVLGTDGHIGLDLTRGVTQIGSRVSTGLTYGAGTRLRLRARVDGHRVRARVWAASGTEPTEWQLDQTVTTDTIPAGNLGVFVSAFSGNTNTAPWVEFERAELHYPMAVENTLTGTPGVIANNPRLVESAQAGTVTLHTPTGRAVYDDTYTVLGKPMLRVGSGPHRRHTPRLRFTLPPVPFGVRWYTRVPQLQDAGWGTNETRWVVDTGDQGPGLLFRQSGSGLHQVRAQPRDLAAGVLTHEYTGPGIHSGQLLRVEIRQVPTHAVVRVFAGHSHQVLDYWTFPGLVLSETLNLGGYRYRLRPTLMWGDQGTAVAALQNELMDLGYDLSPWYADGDFGQLTHQRVMDFQSDHGLSPVDGAAGPETRAAMDMALGRTPPPLWVSHLAVSDGPWVGPAEEPLAPVSRVRAGFSVGLPI